MSEPDHVPLPPAAQPRADGHSQQVTRAKSRFAGFNNLSSLNGAFVSQLAVVRSAVPRGNELLAALFLR
jgi:hypothetical protein